ncbi:MAG: hypothetical protein VX990_05875 [Pseudomonadota bacterium]|nr:hypothetical protein [Pseudomonadota bacterium]
MGFIILRAIYRPRLVGSPKTADRRIQKGFLMRMVAAHNELNLAPSMVGAAAV